MKEDIVEEFNFTRIANSIKTLVDFAHSRNWNGVENSKFLEVFLIGYIEHLENRLSKYETVTKEFTS